jgi:hypothetical protein
MSQLSTLLRHLEAYVQEEIGAQGRTLALLEAQQAAVATSEPESVAKATQAIEDELRTVAARARRRDELLRGFARFWNIDPQSLTFASLIERAGPEGERLRRQRRDLRTTAGRVARRARVVGTAARAHQRLTAEIIETVLADDERQAAGTGGVLVDAEA